MSSWLDYFIGSSQSRYAFFAIFGALVAICMAIIFTNNDISLAKRMIIVLFVLFVSIFPIGISLFELNCMVTGGKSQSGFNYCSSYAWVITAMIIVYCFFLIIATLISMFTYKKAAAKIEISQKANAISDKDANTIAKNMINTTDEKSPSNAESFVGNQSSQAYGGMNAAQMVPPQEHAQQANMTEPLQIGGTYETFEQKKAKREEFGGTYETFEQKKAKREEFRGNTYETFEQNKAKKEENVVGYGSHDDFMQYERETFVNAPPSTVEQRIPVSKKHMKKGQTIDENEPKPYVDQIENFATI